MSHHEGRGPHLLLVVTEDWYYWSHRRSIARAALRAGFRVTLASRFGEHRERIEADGVETVDLRLRRRSGPTGAPRAFVDLLRTYRRLRPDVVHHVAIKPVILGSWAARATRVPAVVNAVTGLGYAFTARGWRPRILRVVGSLAYASALRGRRTVTIFQNGDDRATFVRRRLVAAGSTVLIPGSGVDLDVFRPTPEPPGPFTVLFAGRLLWSKGVGDLVEAVGRLRDGGRTLRLVLAGHSDADNPEAIPERQLDEWVRTGAVEWAGRTEDVAAAMAGAHVVVLTSDREGIPKVLVEAAGAGRPIVASAVPGCRDVVADGVNGLLVPVDDPGALATALERLLDDPALRARMGAAGRRRAEEEFAEPIVVGSTIDLYRLLLDEASPP